jgi:PAS domain S-box-containing protein
MMKELLASADQDPAAAKTLVDARLTPYVRDQMQPLINALQQNAKADVTRRLRNAERAMAAARTRRNYVTLVSLAVALALGWLIAWSIGKPLTKLTEATAEVAKGRLDTRVDIRSRDEIGKLAQSFNQMAAELETTTVAKTYVDDIIRSIHEMLIVTDPQLEIRRVNPTVVRKLGFSNDELVGRSLGELLGEPVDHEGGTSSLPAQFFQAREQRLRTKSQQLLPVWFTASHLNDPDGQLQGYVCVATDISDRKVAEERLRTSLREKEVLLKEVHHRVKNNLQIISSLLNLQAQATAATEAARALRESQSRIHSMSLIHEQLYRSDNLASIDFAEYVRELTAHVSRSVGAATRNVSVHVEVESAPLPIELAVPCGMIVNELVTNAMEHAFPDGRDGEIRIGFRSDGRRRELTVCDNGVGLTPLDDRRSSASLGLKVVHALAEQIGGKLDLRHRGGTQCIVQFGFGDLEDPAIAGG